jgi:hypothetical protein
MVTDLLQHVSMIKDLPSGLECVVIGTLFKDMKLKPNILDEYDKEVCASGCTVYIYFSKYVVMLNVMCFWFSSVACIRKRHRRVIARLSCRPMIR